MRMKIINVISWGYETGGAESHVQSMNSYLRTQGHQVITLASDSGPSDLRFDDFQFRTIPTHGLKKLLYTAYNVHTRRAIMALVESFKPDVVVLHTLTQASAATVLALQEIPTVACVHGPEHFTLGLLNWTLAERDFRDESHQIRELTWIGWLHYAFYRYVCRPLYRRGFRHVNEVIAYSTFVTDLLRAEGFPASYMPMGVSLLSVVPVDQTRRNVLFVGRLVSFKGVFVMIDAFREVLRVMPNATLTIAGAGEMKARMEEIVRSEGLEQAVEFLGQVPASGMAEVYARATVVIMPSIFPEAFGKVGVEAMSVGRPVIASDVGGVRDWLEDGVNGLLVRPAESRDLAIAITELLEDLGRVEQMGKAARRTAEKFSLESHMEKFEELLHRVRDNANSTT